MYDPEEPIIIREIVGDDITLIANYDIILRPFWDDEEEYWRINYYDFGIFLCKSDVYYDFKRQFGRDVLHDWKMYKNWPENTPMSQHTSEIMHLMLDAFREVETVRIVECPTKEEMLKDTILDKSYMCMIDYEEELGHASDGVRVYPSLNALKEHHICWEECGIVEVEVKFKKIIVDQNLYNE